MKAVRNQQSAVISQKSEYGLRFLLVFVLVFGLYALCPLLFADTASAELTVNANHDHITIDFLYHGSTVSVGGLSDPDMDLIVKISSPDGHESLKRKGKVAGFLWMNTGDLKMEKVPNLYSIHSTKKIEDILDPEEMDKYVIGYSALERHVEMSSVSNEQEKTRWFSEFLRFKESQRLYAASAGKLSLKQESGRQAYYILTDWPYQAPPGEYAVNVYAVRGGRVVGKAESRVKVEQVGIVKYLSNMARNNGAVYGILSIVAALGAGFGVGMIFRKGGGAH